tara:strand:- start:239 stop:637 length:399 start_codon:yes stop_codon:yes gene_type:complete
MWKNRRRQDHLEMIHEQLTKLAKRVGEDVRHNSSLVDEAEKLVLETHRAQASAGDLPELESPGFLSAMITALIYKYGTARISLADFTEASKDYVSVYVDGTSKEIILSLDHSLGAESIEFANFADPDDQTFH